jgi:hypothetical protein
MCVFSTLVLMEHEGLCTSSVKCVFFAKFSLSVVMKQFSDTFYNKVETGLCVLFCIYFGPRHDSLSLSVSIYLSVISILLSFHTDILKQAAGFLPR